MSNKPSRKRNDPRAEDVEPDGQGYEIAEEAPSIEHEVETSATVVVKAELSFADWQRGDLREVTLDELTEKFIAKGWLINVEESGI